MSMVNRSGFRTAIAGAVLLILVLLLQDTIVSAQGTRPQELDTHFNRAEAAWRGGTSMLEAKVRIDRVLTAVPDDVEALKLRAEILIALDRPVDAMRDARQVTRLVPHDGEAYAIMGEAACMAGDLDMAAEAVDRALENLPNISAMFLRVARTAMLVGAYEQAEYSTRRALSISPRDANAHYQLAGVLMRTGRSEEAAMILASGLEKRLLEIDVIRRDDALRTLLTYPILADSLN